MKRNLFLTVALTFLSGLAFSIPTQNERQFIKGNISEKIEIIKNLSEGEKNTLSQKGLDFVIENARTLGEDSDLLDLALVSVTALSADENLGSDEQKKISEKLMTVFRLLKDRDVRSAVLEKLEIYLNGDKTLAVDFLNDYLSSAYKSAEKSANVHERSIALLGKIGNEESLSIIYSIWQSKIWPEFKDTTDNALVTLSQESFADSIKIFSVSNMEDAAHYFSLLHKSPQISQNSLCDIAENALLFAINNAESLKAQSKDAERTFLDFQIEAQEVLASHKWSHASSVIQKNVLLAKKSYDSGILSDADFAALIRTSVQIPSHELAQSLCDMLSECNGKVEDVSQDSPEMPAKSVVLALISALGELGDKTAFDTLLYVTYIPYPSEVIDEAKSSLAKLKW